MLSKELDQEEIKKLAYIVALKCESNSDVKVVCTEVAAMYKLAQEHITNINKEIEDETTKDYLDAYAKSLKPIIKG